MSDFLSPDVLVLGFIFYLVFLFSTTCHEAAHAWVAKLGGDTTAAEGGQVSLNPIPHIRRSPYGMVIFPLLSFFLSSGTSMIGFASAPFNPTWERQHPRRSAWMALAGPATNFILMIIGVIGLRAGFAFHLLDPGSFATKLLTTLFSLNLLLGIFNLIPVPPLDGSTAIMLFMGENTTQKYLDLIRGGTFALPGLLVSLIIFRFIFPDIQRFAVKLFFF